MTPPCIDLSATPRRYLRREWKRNKPYLRTSDSLPSLHLCPNRPLFVCARCGFSNTLIPMCLWCAWSSAAAKSTFEEMLPRPRRMTAPSMPSPRLRCEQERARCAPRRVSVDSTSSSAGPVTPQGDLMFYRKPVITAVLESCPSGLPCFAHPKGVQKTANVMLDVVVDAHEIYPQGDRGVDVGENIATATSNLFSLPSTASGKQDLADGPDKRETEHRVLKKQSIRHRRKLPALFLATLSSTHARATPDPHDSSRRSLPLMTQDMNSNSSSILIDAPRATDGKVYIGGVSHALSLLSVSSTSSSQCSPNHKLRRKKRMPLPKSASSLSFRSQSQQSFPTYDDHAESPVPHATRALHAAPTRSPAPSTLPTPVSAEPPIRIGHPTRPYYTVIRKNMSRPGTPVQLPRTPSPLQSDYDYAPRATKSLDCGERAPVQFGLDSRPMSMVIPGQVIPVNVYSGFSLSGETEMRMNLARWRKEDAPNEPEEYLFKETTRGCSLRHGMLKEKVKRFGRGLRDLVLRRS